MEPKYSDLKKAFGKKAKLIYIIMFIICTVAAFFGGRASNNINITNIVGDGKTLGLEAPDPALSTPIPSEKNTCPSKYFTDLKNDWNFVRYSMNNNSQVCANVWSSFPYPDLTYNIPLKQDFELFEIVYKIDHGKNYTNSLGISVGDNPKIIRYFIQEGNPKIVGTEVLDLDNQKLKRIEPNILSDTPKDGTSMFVSLRSNIKMENQLTYVLNIKYISDSTNKPSEDSFSQDVVLSEPTPNSQTTINISVPKGNCFTPVSYKVCN